MLASLPLPHAAYDTLLGAYYSGLRKIFNEFSSEIENARAAEHHLDAAMKAEISGRFSQALELFDDNKDVFSRSGQPHLAEFNIDRILQRVQDISKALMQDPLPLLEHQKNPSTITNNEAASREAVVSLTTISGRLSRVIETVNCIRRQSSAIHSINLYISDEPYLLDQGINRKDPLLKELYGVGVNIYLVPNIGPYRKQHFVIKQLRTAEVSEDTIFVTVDDDVLYPEDSIGPLVEACHSQHCVAAQRGREMRFIGNKVGPYRSFNPPTAKRSHANLATGKNGVAYKLRFFPKDESLFVGPALAPTADDLWCKWITAFYCVPTLITEPMAAYDSSKDYAVSNKDDNNSLFRVYNARGTNDTAMHALEIFFAKRLISVGRLHGAEIEA